MGEYTHSEIDNIKQKKQLANQLINKYDGLKTLCVLFNEKISKMGDV